MTTSQLPSQSAIQSVAAQHDLEKKKEKGREKVIQQLVSAREGFIGANFI